MNLCVLKSLKVVQNETCQILKRKAEKAETLQDNLKKGIQEEIFMNQQYCSFFEKIEIFQIIRLRKTTIYQRSGELKTKIKLFRGAQKEGCELKSDLCK